MRAFLRFDTDEELWNERIILVQVDGDRWMCLTPDLDIVCETLAVPPLRGIKYGDGTRLPYGLGAGHGKPVYRFDRGDVPAGARLAELVAEATAAIPGLPPVVAVAPVADAAVARAPAAIPARRRLPPPRGDARADVEEVAGTGRPPAPTDMNQRLWIVDTAGGALAFGTSLTAAEMSLSGTVAGDRGLFWRDGQVVSVRAVPTADLAASIASIRSQFGPAAPPTPREPAGPAPTADDVRTMAVVRTSAGTRFRDWRSVGENLDQVTFPEADWGLAGPRCAAWYIRELAKCGLGPAARHNQWRFENKLNDDDRLCCNHEMLSEILELFGTIDQLDLSNLAGAESLTRYLQHIEYEAKKKVEARAGYDEAEDFLGRPRRATGGLICPELMEFVANKAAKRSAVMKEQRKAAEERALARPPKGGGRGAGGAGGAAQ